MRCVIYAGVALIVVAGMLEFGLTIRDHLRTLRGPGR